MAYEDVRNAATALPAGTRLGEFEVRSIIGVGGFGIVYLAFDHALEREVAVKEYMPQSLAGRTDTLHVSLRSTSDADTFSLGLKSFVNEARLLAKFDHPSLLKVHRFWEANGTAYMSMPVYRGHTFKSAREQRIEMGLPPNEAWLREKLLPLLGAIEVLHGAGVYHRDIAPDNILIEAGDGRPVLLDFGAARRVISDKSQALTAILKPAYAPIEQYAEAGSVRQGPWTDLYALGATLHFMLLGRPPSPATTRTVHDDQVPLAAQGLAGCSEGFLNLIDWMIAPRPADRPQSVAAVRDVLEGRAAAPRPAVPPPPSAWERTQVQGTAGAVTRPLSAPADDPTVVVPRTGGPYAMGGSMVTPPAVPPTVAPAPVPPAPPAIAAAPANVPPPAPPVPPARAPQPAAGLPAESRSSKAPLVVVGAAALVAVAAAAWALWPRPVVPQAGAGDPAPAASVAERSDPAALAPAATPPAVTPEPETTPVAAVSESKPPPAVEPPPRPEERVAKPNVPARPSTRLPAGTDGALKPQPTRPEAPVRAEETPPAQAAATDPAHTAAVPAASAAPAGPRDPAGVCGKRVFIALARCMQRVCEQPDYAGHPACRANASSGAQLPQ